MKVITFGEMMMRLSPIGADRFLQTGTFESYFGGSEANTAVALSSLGTEAAFVTKLPQNEIADACLRELKGNGVDTAYVARGGERMGLYYCENGAGVRGGKVIYDRKHSAISEAQIEDFDWDKILAGGDVFHFTGITTALSDGLAEITLAAVKSAKDEGLTVSCDLNYRRTLWSREKAEAVLNEFMPYVDILFANSGSAEDVFHITGEEDEAVMAALSTRFGIETVAFTQRTGNSANRNTLGGILLTAGEFYRAAPIAVDIVDRVGGGDCFDAGLLHGILNEWSPQEMIEFANACNAYKHTVRGDWCRLPFDEVAAIAEGSADGKIKR